MSRLTKDDNIFEQDKGVFSSLDLLSKQQGQFNYKSRGEMFNRKASVPNDRNSKNPIVYTVRDGQKVRLKDVQNNVLNDVIIEEIRKYFQNNIKVNTIPIRGYNYKDDMDIYPSENVMNNSVRNRISDIIAEVRKFKELEDPRDQVECCAYICKETLDILKNSSNSKSENYCASTLRLFYQAVKRNYAKGLFTDEQVRLMLDMLEECQSGYVDKERYWEFDERLYNAHLSVFPEED